MNENKLQKEIEYRFIDEQLDYGVLNDETLTVTRADVLSDVRRILSEDQEDFVRDADARTTLMLSPDLSKATLHLSNFPEKRDDTLLRQYCRTRGLHVGKLTNEVSSFYIVSETDNYREDFENSTPADVIDLLIELMLDDRSENYDCDIHISADRKSVSVTCEPRI